MQFVVTCIADFFCGLDEEDAVGYFLLLPTIISSTCLSVSFMECAPMLTRLRTHWSTSSSMMPSMLLTQLPCMASMAERTAVLTPEVSLRAHEGLAPSQIMPVRLAIMFFTAAQICS